MKYTTEQLAKVDWTKFTKDGWSVTTINGPQLRLNHSVFAAIDQGGDWIVTNQTAIGVRNVLSQIDRCDAFIATELAAIEALEQKERTKRTKPDPGEGFELIDETTALASPESTWTMFDDARGWIPGWSDIRGYSASPTKELYAFRRPIAKPLQLTFTHPPTILQPNTIAIIDGVAYTVEKSVRVGDIETAELKRIQPTKPA